MATEKARKILREWLGHEEGVREDYYGDALIATIVEAEEAERPVRALICGNDPNHVVFLGSAVQPGELCGCVLLSDSGKDVGECSGALLPLIERAGGGK